MTTPGRTLVDVAGRLDRRSFDAAFHYCLHSRLTTHREMREHARLSSGCPGAQNLREALAAYGPRGSAAASPLEARVARRLHRSTLPPPVRQHEVRLPSGRRYLDFAWPAARVAVEVDGYRWHSSRTAWERDRARLRELRRAGWTIVHTTQDDVDGGFDQLVRELTPLLGDLIER
ncbi:MAG: DUF559 domain-containing protein [Actinomycetota bacterium]|nr:DUF559 domain-containing protein [Actinomycetota bacterium]